MSSNGSVPISFCGSELRNSADRSKQDDSLSSVVRGSFGVDSTTALLEEGTRVLPGPDRCVSESYPEALSSHELGLSQHHLEVVAAQVGQQELER